MCSQVQVTGARDQELPSATSLPAKVNLGLVFRDRDDCHANQAAEPASASEGTASLGDPEEDGNLSRHSPSPASSQCSATYSNLGKTGPSKLENEFLKLACSLEWSVMLSTGINI